MTLRKKIFLFFIIIFITIVIVVFLHNNYTEQLKVENDFFKINLQPFVIPNITLSGREYTIREGRIILKNNISLKKQNQIYKIAFYSLFTRIDPLFALPYTDIDILKTNIDNLDNSVRELSLYYYPNEEKILQSSFYPIDFLNTLPNLEAVRRLVVSAPTARKIKEYDRILKKTIQVYKHDIKILETIYSNKFYEGKVFSYPVGSVTIDAYRNFLQTLKNEAYVSDGKIKNRFDCFNGLIRKCSLLPDSLIQETIPLKENSQIEKLYDIPADIEEHRQIQYAYHPIDIDIYSAETQKKYINTPVVILQESFCLPHNDNVYYGIAPREFPGSPIDRVVILNDAYFYNLTTAHPQWGALTVAMKESIPFSYQPLATPYFCPDYTLDAARVFSILKIRSLLTEYDLFNKNEIHDDRLLDNLKNLEKNITGHLMVYENDIIQFLNILLVYFQRESAVLVFSNNDKLFIEQLFLLYKTQDAGFEQILLALANDLEYVISFIKLGVKADIYDLFLTRAALSLTYLGFNGSVLQTLPIIVSDRKNNVDAFLPLSYQKNLKNNYSLEEIIHVIKKTDSFKGSSGIRF